MFLKLYGDHSQWLPKPELHTSIDKNQVLYIAKFLFNPEDNTKYATKPIDNAGRYYLACIDVNGLRIVFEYEPIKRAFLNLATRVKNGEADNQKNKNIKYFRILYFFNLKSCCVSTVISV
jgi:hypothetical protein